MELKLQSTDGNNVLNLHVLKSNSVNLIFLIILYTFVHFYILDLGRFSYPIQLCFVVGVLSLAYIEKITLTVTGFFTAIFLFSLDSIFNTIKVSEFKFNDIFFWIILVTGNALFLLIIIFYSITFWILFFVINSILVRFFEDKFKIKKLDLSFIVKIALKKL